MTDWLAWHAKYDDPDGSLSRRLTVVRRRTGEVLDGLAGDPSILSLCSGDGRDVLPELAARGSRRHRVTLVEKDEILAARAVTRARDLGLHGVRVKVGDAGKTAAFEPYLPVDLLILCGIFGNITDDDIRATIAATPAMLRAGGSVIWTRGSKGDTDLRPLVRAWFVEAGLSEVAFDCERDGFGVGVDRLEAELVSAAPLPAQLFSFIR